MSTYTAHNLANRFYSKSKEELISLKEFYSQKAQSASDQIIKQFWNTKVFACTIALKTKKEK